jgi:general secretion pathway protein C
MNLLTNSRFIQTIWWIVVPLLVAQFFISFFMLFIVEKKQETLYTVDKKSAYIYNFPKFFTPFLKQNGQLKVVKKIGNLKLKACYVEKGKEFVVISEGAKTIFVDLNDEYKGAKLISISNTSAVFLKNGERIELTLVKKISFKTITDNTKTVQNDDKYISVKRDSFKKYVQNPKQALRDVRFQEIKKDKKFAGLKLSFIRKGSLFDKMKLQKGDIIKFIDGNRLQSMMDLLPYYNLLDNTTTILIGFERGVEMKEIMYEIN